MDIWPPFLPREIQSELIRKTLDFAYGQGLIIKGKGEASATHAPIALFPSPYPKACYDQAKYLQPLLNYLMDQVARDKDFLKEVLVDVSLVDEFTGRLFKLYQSCDSPQKIWCGLFRSDYLIHYEKEPVIKQVEFNTIASSFGGLSTLVSRLHRYMAQRTDFFNEHSTSTPNITVEQLPENRALETLGNGLFRAHQLFGDTKAVLLMIVQPGETNVFDQRLLEYKLFEKGVKVVRKSLKQVFEQGSLENNQLRIDSHIVSVVYFRAGYTPNDYPSEDEWKAREMIEASLAIKCPNIALHLAGCKKIQQVLAEPNRIEKYLNSQHSQIVRKCFTGLYPLDQSLQGNAAFEKALQEPSRFVMKPQREGGGNNLYGDDMVQALKTLDPKQRNAFILMDLIKPLPLKNTMLRLEKDIVGPVISELGIYGAWISDGNVIYMNEGDGHLLRTKSVDSNEGGVAAGFAVLDSPFLISK